MAFNNSRLRLLLLITFLVGIIGTVAELILLEHTEIYWQLAPIVLIGLGFVLIMGYELKPGRNLMRVFRLTMILFFISGLVGIWLHYQGNAEFEKEMYPTIAGFDLFWESMKGATPALAPGTMMALGLVGWSYSYVAKNS